MKFCPSVYAAPCCHKPFQFCSQRAPTDQRRVSAWHLGCFLMANVSFSRLRSISKERGGHPRRSCVGVAARRGNPGQEGRNQGRRANERVSGEVSLFFPLSVQHFAVLCVFLCLFSFYVWLSISFYLSVSPSVCVSLSVTAFVCLCFGGGTGSCGSDNFLLAPHVCVLVIVCDCAAARRCFTTIPVTWFTGLYLWVRLLRAVWEKSPPPHHHLFAPCHPLHSILCSVLQKDASLTAVCQLCRSSFSPTECCLVFRATSDPGLLLTVAQLEVHPDSMTSTLCPVMAPGSLQTQSSLIMTQYFSSVSFCINHNHTLPIT